MAKGQQRFIQSIVLYLTHALLRVSGGGKIYILRLVWTGKQGACSAVCRERQATPMVGHRDSRTRTRKASLTKDGFAALQSRSGARYTLCAGDMTQRGPCLPSVYSVFGGAPWRAGGRAGARTADGQRHAATGSCARPLVPGGAAGSDRAFFFPAR